MAISADYKWATSFLVRHSWGGAFVFAHHTFLFLQQETRIQSDSQAHDNFFSKSYTLSVAGKTIPFTAVALPAAFSSILSGFSFSFFSLSHLIVADSGPGWRKQQLVAFSEQYMTGLPAHWWRLTPKFVMISLKLLRGIKIGINPI